MSDRLLMFWICCETVSGMFVFGVIAYVVFWRGHSGWWFIVAAIFCSAPTLVQALRKRFEIKGEQ